MSISRFVFLALILSLVSLAYPAEAGIWKVSSGLANQRQTDRQSEEQTNHIDFIGAVSYTSPEWNFILDLHLSWDAKTKKIDRDVWDRKGDFLRPLEALVYSFPDKEVSFGFQVLDNWTPGAGYLVRDLTGRAEIDYVLPGILFKWESETLKVEVGTDRPVDPTVQAASLTWGPWEDVRIVVEGAVDPEAPEVYNGTFTDGRPEADETSRVSGLAAGVQFPLRDGKVLDIKAGGHAARLNGDASGMGFEATVSLDMSSYYVNRLSFKGERVDCSGGYVPAWFDAVYPVWRWGLTGGQTPLALNPLDGSGNDKSLESLDIIYELGDNIRLGLGADRFRDDSLKRARFTLDLKESAGRGIQAALWSRADGPDEELFKVDENFFVRVSALYAFLPHMLVKVTYDRSWAFREESEGLVPVSSILLGVMYNISL